MADRYLITGGGSGGNTNWSFGPQAVTVVGGHGSEGQYDEPRRVYINGLPYTVRSKAEYMALLRKHNRAKEQANRVIETAREKAREAAFSPKDLQETSQFLNALMEKERSKKVKTMLLLLVASNE